MTLLVKLLVKAAIPVHLFGNDVQITEAKNGFRKHKTVTMWLSIWKSR